MRTWMIPAGLCALALTTLVHAEDAPATEAKSYGTNGQTAFQLQVPTAWKDLSKKPPAGARVPAVLQFDALEGEKHFSVKITYIISPKIKAMTDADIKRTALSVSKHYINGSVEKKADLQPIKGDQVAGYSATFTDASDKPGEFPVVTTVTAKLGDGLIAATIQHPKDSVNQPLALEMLRTATLGGVGGKAAAGKPAGVTMESPNKRWQLQFDLPNAAAAETQISVDRKASQLETQSTDGIICTAFIEPADKPGPDATVVRAHYWNKEKQAPIDYTKVVESGDATLALLTFTTAGANPNAHAYLVHEGKWIDIHLSKPGGTDADTDAMIKVLKTVRFVPTKGS